MLLSSLVDNTITHLNAIKRRLVVSWPAIVNGMLSALVMLCLFHFFMPSQKIGTVNVTGMLDQYIKESAKKTMSSDELKRNVHLFGQTLEETLQAISKKEQVLLLPREAVIAGSVDYTSVVSEHLKKSLLRTKK